MSNFDTLIGHAGVKSYLERLIKMERIPQALLFTGPEGIGKSLCAHLFAHSLLQSQADLILYRPQGKIGMHSIDSIRQLIEEAMLAPFQSLRKFLIIEEADRMLTYSANALLKTLEEPPPTTTLILISHEPQFILPTLLSRCQRVSFTSLSVDELTSLIQKKWDKPQEEAHNLALLSRGSMGRACRFIDQKGNTLRNLLLEQLALGSFNTHRQRVEFSQKLEEEIEKLQKMEEDQEEEKKLAGWGENLPATLRDSIQKEIEGAMTRRLNLEAALLFDELLFWFRDLHLLQVGADPSLLFHPDWKETLQQRVQRGHLIPLTAVQKAVEEAKLSLVRMTSLSHCFENLFLQLDSQT